MLCALLSVITLVELRVQFSNNEYFGTEESGFIIMTINLLGGTASHDFTVSVMTLPMTAAGELSIQVIIQ